MTKHNRIELTIYTVIDPPESVNKRIHNLNEQRCYLDTNDGNWLIIQRRGANAENFNRSWVEYKNGFGDLNGDFWYGNDLLHRLTHDVDMELRVTLENCIDTTINLDYGIFRVDSEQYNYNLIIGDAKIDDIKLDSFSYHNNQDFSTFDRRNDKTLLNDTVACCSCAVSYGGGWWFDK